MLRTISYFQHRQLFDFSFPPRYTQSRFKHLASSIASRETKTPGSSSSGHSTDQAKNHPLIVDLDFFQLEGANIRHGGKAYLVLISLASVISSLIRHQDWKDKQKRQSHEQKLEKQIFRLNLSAAEKIRWERISDRALDFVCLEMGRIQRKKSRRLFWSFCLPSWRL